MRSTRVELEYRRKVLAEEMSKDIDEFFKDTFYRVAEIISKKENKPCTITSITNQWSYFKKEINNIIKDNKYGLTKEQMDVLVSKVNAYRISNKPSDDTYNSYDRLSESIKLEFLKYVAKYYKKRVPIRTMVNNFLNSKEIDDKKLEDKLIMAWYKYLGLSTNNMNLTADEKEKIRLYREVYIVMQNRKAMVKFDPEINEEELSNKESKKKKVKVSTNVSNNTNSNSTNLNEKKEDDNMLKEMYNDSDFILKENQDGTYTMIKGISYVDREFVSEKLKSNDKVLVLTSDKEVIAKNFL